MRVGRILLIPNMLLHEHRPDPSLNRGQIEHSHSPLSSSKILLVSRGEESPDQDRYSLALAHCSTPTNEMLVTWPWHESWSRKIEKLVFLYLWGLFFMLSTLSMSVATSLVILIHPTTSFCSDPKPKTISSFLTDRNLSTEFEIEHDGFIFSLNKDLKCCLVNAFENQAKYQIFWAHMDI